MKPTLFTLTVILGIIAVAGCNSKQPDKTETSTAILQGDCGQALDTVNRVLCPLVTARQHTQAYDSICRHVHGSDSLTIHAYTIRAVDLLAAMGMPPALADSNVCRFKHVRVYLGYQEKVGFKLYIVPVDGACLKGADKTKWQAGVDVLLDKNARPILAADSGSNGMATDDTYVLDLNAPCPNTCPTGVQQLLTGKK